jgi:hypothetical protein
MAVSFKHYHSNLNTIIGTKTKNKSEYNDLCVSHLEDAAMSNKMPHLT